MFTKEQCQEVLRFRDSHQYTLRHGEYSRPISKIRKHSGQDCYGIVTKYSYLPGTFSAMKDGWEDEFALELEYNRIIEFHMGRLK